MKTSTALIFCCAFILVSGEDTPKNPVITADKIDVNTLLIANGSIPSPSNTTITPPSTTPTTIPTTTVSTSTTSSTTTTNPIPTSTTTAPSTTSAPPVPKDPETNTWSVNGTNNNVIIVRLATQLVITYKGLDKKNWSIPINVPANKNITKANGTFASNVETLVLYWKGSKGGDNVVSLSFKSDNAKKTYVLSRFEATIDQLELPNSNLSASLKLVHAHDHFNTTVGNSYRCVRLQHFNLTDMNNNTVFGVAKVTDLRFQAFENKNKGGFGLAEDCAFDTPDVVPIAVGCSLAGLVVIVLVAYLVSRRDQTRGYLSM